MTGFHLIGIDPGPFVPLFSLPEADLSRLNAQRVVADRKPGFPCRVSLVDADIGEQLLLLPFEHQPAASPYRSSGPIYVRRDARRAVLGAGVLPDYVRSRLIAARAYDAAHQMTDASVIPGTDAARIIDAMFSRREVAYIHLHNAGRGCFSCTVHRLDPPSDA